MFLIVGLGNPGNKYMLTRHNLGFMCIDKIASEFNIELKKEKFKAIYGEGKIANEKVILLKPQTYMNLSGISVSEIVNFYKIDLDKIIVIYDDIDIDVGKIKIRKKGSAGTHNGMKSVIASLKSQDFTRIRVGSGKPNNNVELMDYVLQNLSKDEQKIMEDVLNNVSGAVRMIVNQNVDVAMNKYN